jgi:hypothetical protein
VYLMGARLCLYVILRPLHDSQSGSYVRGAFLVWGHPRFGRWKWQDDAEGGATTKRSLELQSAAVLLQNAHGDG